MSRWKTLVLIISVIILDSNLLAYDEEYAHPDLTESAIGKSSLDEYLKNYLVLPDGARTIYDGISITKLIQTGSTNEDLGTRPRNHFWNPLNDEGLDDYVTGLSNRSWAMGFDESGEPLYACGSGDHWYDGSCNDYSWRRAREEFYAALTGTSDANRKEHFKKMYESLGRVLHLIEDMSVPAHTRNDFVGHLNYTELKGLDPRSWVGNLYEFYVKRRAGKDPAYISHFSATASIPVLDTPQEYWGAGIYDGSNPEMTAEVSGQPQAGLAEYCNANFPSRFTMFTNGLPHEDKHCFPFPNESSLSSLSIIPQEVTAEDGMVDQVIYLAKDKHGEPIGKFVAAKYLWDRLSVRSENDMTAYYRLAYYLDDSIHEAYATKLIPRTIGYGAGLINYFFRGTISIMDNTIETFDSTYHIHLSVRNTTGSSEEMDMGSISLVIRYPLDAYSYGYITVPEAGNIHEITRDTPASLSFDVPRDGLPDNRLNGLLDLFIVYKGNLSGSSPHETDAVCVGHQQIEYFSPTKEVLHAGIMSGSAFYEGYACAQNLLKGCRYMLTIENKTGCAECCATFVRIDFTDFDNTAGDCPSKFAGTTAIGETIPDLAEYDRQNKTKPGESCPGGIPAGLTINLNHIVIGGTFTFQVVLTNMTTGTEVARCTASYHN